MRQFVIAFAVLSAALFGSDTGALAGKLGPEFRADTTSNGQQTVPSVAGLSDRGYVAIWSSEPNHDGFGSGVYGRRYNAKGKPKGKEEFLVNTTVKEDQLWASVAGLAKGGFVVAWTSYHKIKSLSDVFARLYDRRGNPLGEEFRVNTYKKSHQARPAVAGLKNGNFVVIWQSYEQDGDGYGVYGQRYNRNGKKKGKEFQVNRTTQSLQGEADVAALSDGGIAVVWVSHGQDGDGTGVYGQRFNAKGKRKRREFRVNNTKAGLQGFPSVAGLAKGGFVVAWSSENLDGSETGVAARRYKASGKPKGKEKIVNTYNKLSQGKPSVAALAKGGYVVTWESEDQDDVEGQNIDLSGVYGQRFKDNGKRNGKELQIPTFLEGRQRNPAVAGLSKGRKFVVMWESDGQDFGGFNIYGQRMK